MASNHGWGSIGTSRVMRIDDLQIAPLAPNTLIPNWDAEQARQPDLQQTLDPSSGNPILSIHSWLVQDRGRNIIIDTGAGNGKSRPHAQYFDHLQTAYLERLAAAGVEPDQVDLVLLTHLHVDHAGWNTRLENGRWVPTFPNARYVFSRAELEFFSDPSNYDERHKTSFQVREDSVDPILDAGLAELVEVTGDEVVEGFHFHSTPGHTPSHVSIEMRSGGEIALFPGDVMHHPVQIAHPSWNSVFDADTERAASSRAWALDFAAEREAIIFSSHFPLSSKGKVQRAGEAYSWTFV